jgi:hypothetical protein
LVFDEWLTELVFELVDEEAVVEQVGSAKARRSRKRKQKHKQERSVDEAAQILWKIIDEAKSYMADPLLNSEEKRRWAKTLADTIGVLNKLLANLGERQVEDEDLAMLLTRVPRVLRVRVVKRVMMWRKASF